MKNTLITLASLAALAVSANAQTFADFTGTTDGDTSGTATYGTGNINWNVSFLSNSNGLNPGNNAPSPRSNSTFDSDLFPFTGGPTSGVSSALLIFAGTVDGTNNNVGYDLTFDFAGGAPADTTFYISDVDSGDFQVSANLGTTTVDVSDWYFGLAQTSSNPSGSPSVWDGNDTLVGSGASNRYVHQFRADEVFDNLTFSFTGGTASDGIWFGIGDVTVVPEPSSTALLGLGGLALILRRRK